MWRLNCYKTARVTCINRNTVNRYYLIFREKIATFRESINMGFKGEIELDESFLVVEGKAEEEEVQPRYQYLVFWRGNATKREVRPIIRHFVSSGSRVYTDRGRAYDGIMLDWFNYNKIDHDKGFINEEKIILME